MPNGEATLTQTQISNVRVSQAHHDHQQAIYTTKSLLHLLITHLQPLPGLGQSPFPIKKHHSSLLLWTCTSTNPCLGIHSKDLERGMNWKKHLKQRHQKLEDEIVKCIWNAFSFGLYKSSVRYEHLNKNTFLMDKTSNVLSFNIHFLKVTFIYFFQLKKMSTHSSTQMPSRSDMLRPSYWHHFRPGKSFQNSWKMAVDPKQTSIVKTFLFLLLFRVRSRNSATLQIPGSFLGHFP